MFFESKFVISHVRLFRSLCLNRLTFKSDIKVNFKFAHNLKVITGFNSRSYFNNNTVILPEKVLVLRQFDRTFGSETSDEILQDSIVFEAVCEETLESLCEFFDDLVEARTELRTGDVTFGDGVLTVNLGPKFGTYVINRQSPNRQIWLSSPTSGPKRYDYIPSRDSWVYRHEPKRSLHALIQEELEVITNSTISLSDCAHCGLQKH